MNYKDREALEQAYNLILEGKGEGVPCPCTTGKKCKKEGCECKKCKKALNEDFNAPEEAQAILDDPDQPTGTLPHSMEAVLQELAFWGQHGHQRVMDPEIAKLATQLAELIKSKSEKTGESKPKMGSFRPEARPMAGGFKGKR